MHTYTVCMRCPSLTYLLVAGPNCCIDMRRARDLLPWFPLSTSVKNMAHFAQGKKRLPASTLLSNAVDQLPHLEPCIVLHALCLMPRVHASRPEPVRTASTPWAPLRAQG